MKTKISIIIFFLTFNIFSQSEPSWINNYPTDSQYYTGIGSSNTGNKSDDYERALIQARLNLASEISTNIKAETEISTSDSTSGGLSESFTEKINQSVEQYLKELEIVDSYYSTRQGYWIYIRLNKNRWKEIQNEEIASLLQRIQQIINDDYFGTRVTTSDKLYKLASASSLLDQSPYSGILSGDVGPFYSGNVFDFLQSEIYRISSDISLKMIENEISLESGESKEIRLNCSSSDYYVGKLPVSIINMNNNIIEALTDINGLVRVNISSDLLTEGKNTLLFTIDPLRPITWQQLV